jgi:hypothetical protein
MFSEPIDINMEEEEDDFQIVRRDVQLNEERINAIRRRHAIANPPQAAQLRNNDIFDNGILPAINGLLPLSIEGIDEREIYTRFTSSELASYMINLLKERIHTLRLIFTLFVLVFTNLTNMVILLPNKVSFWETVLKQMIYFTPIVQFVWFVLLIMGQNNSRFYIFLKFSIIGLISLTSVVAYFGVLEDHIFKK